MRQGCECCEGVERLTPAPTANPPGLSALHYRAGTHGSFLQTMLARLSDLRLDGKDPLGQLRVRSGDDPSIALLDAWATVADVLTFYQERIANEGYLRTVTERRSILELARLIGYRLRPGVAASTYLAYLLDVVPGTDTVATVPKGSRAQSVPGPGELPQSFETADDLDARASWNTLRPRLTRPTILMPDIPVLYVDGLTTGVRPNDRLLLNTGEATPVVRVVDSVTADPVAERTVLTLQAPPPPPSAPQPLAAAGTALLALGPLLGALSQPPSVPPAHASDLDRDPSVLFGAGSDLGAQLLAAARPAIGETLYHAWAGATVVAPPPADRLQVERVRAVPYGATAPRKPVLNDNGVAIGTEEWPLESSATIRARVSLTDRNPTSVVVEMTDGVNIATANVRLPTGNAGKTVTFPSLGAVHVLESTNADDVGTGVVTLTYTGAVERTITIGEAGGVIDLAAAVPVGIGVGPVPVVFDDEPGVTWRPESGQTLHREVGDHRVTVALNQRPRVLAISYEQPKAPANRFVLPLDAVYDQIVPRSWVVVERADAAEPIVARVDKVETVSKNSYNFPATVTQLTLDKEWLTPADRLLSAVRQVTVYVQSERFDLVPEPWTDDIKGNSIPLDALYDGLTTGRLLIVSGERTDIPNKTTGVEGTELVMIAGVIQAADPDRPGDTVHTTLTLANDLAYTYRRDTVQIWGNVVAASHGEASSEVLGSGDGTKPRQAFTLRRSPLTYLSADTPSGIQSTLEVRIDGVLWHEQDDLVFLGPTAHAYITRTDDLDVTTVVFGDGGHGARLPTGQENVAATYRTGIGRAGNVQRGQITQLQTRPLGVNGVINPLRASGGADRDSLDQARRNVALGVLALDRLVSVPDYADFARARAGIGKANVRQLSDGARSVVHLTIAGVDDIPIEETSDLFQNLRRSLAQFGDPSQPLVVAMRDLALIVVETHVEVDADHRWDLVEPKIRATLLDRLGFDRRDFGQDVVRSEVIAAIQGVAGVVGVTVTALGVVPGNLDPAQLDEVAKTLAPPPPARIPIELARYDEQERVIRPAQLAMLSRSVPDTLILKER